jgi:membrane protein implicated in regulation of membrane protease activity
VALIAAGVVGLLLPGLADIYWYYLVASTVVAVVALSFFGRTRNRRRRDTKARPR